MCLFHHKWVRISLSKQTFTVNECCSWCGKTRVRSLLPSDEEKHRIDLAYEKGRQERLRIVDELQYERARRAAGRSRVIELERELQDARVGVIGAINLEKAKGKRADRVHIRELGSELRGLMFGRH